MKVFVALVCLVWSLAGALGQGLINFVNTPSTLISMNVSGIPGPIEPPVGSFYFALLTSPVGANNFTFAGVYATNQAAAGFLSGGMAVPVNGWLPGTARDFEVVGWEASAGSQFNSVWVRPDGKISSYPYVTTFLIWQSDIATGVAGGATSSGIVPNLDIFGGATGIQNGFMFAYYVPEPSSMAITVLGVAVWLIFRRRVEAG